jgi:lysophospholipase L1-like esterase
MKYILCYGDSNTWGCAPDGSGRYEFHVRWPGVMQAVLGDGYHVYENALNGRTTVFEDPIEEGRCGKEGFTTALESASPLDLVIIMLGCNDTKLRFNKEPWDIAWGVDLLIQYVKRANCGRNGKPPEILISTPASMGTEWQKTILGTVFDNSSTEKIKKLAQPYAFVAEKNGCRFIDAGSQVKASTDCVHLEPGEHERLGEIFAAKVKEIIG